MLYDYSMLYGDDDDDDNNSILYADCVFILSSSCPLRHLLVSSRCST